MLCCCQYKSPLPTIESRLQYNSRPMKMFISCYPVVPFLEIILWSQFKRRKLLYAFSKKHITKIDFVHPLVGWGRLPGLLLYSFPMGMWGRQWLDPAKSSEPGFTKASCQCSHCHYSQEVHPENVRNRLHCRNTDGLWDGRPLGHDACAVTGIEFRDCFRLLPEGLWEVDKGLLPVGELTGMGAERASSSWELNMSHFPLCLW